MIRKDFVKKLPHGVIVRVDLCTRKITYEYGVGEMYFEFHLLSECLDIIQAIIKQWKLEEKLETISVEDDSDYYEIVTNSKLQFE